MVLVDTSVIIDFLKGAENAKTALFGRVMARKIPFGIASYTYQEVLQGARNEREYGILSEYLSSQKIYFLPEDIESYDAAASMFFGLRRRGITPRSSIDILIALIAVENDLFLLHNDKDFDALAEHVPGLNILEASL